MKNVKKFSRLIILLFLFSSTAVLPAYGLDLGISELNVPILQNGQAGSINLTEEEKDSINNKIAAEQIPAAQAPTVEEPAAETPVDTIPSIIDTLQDTGEQLIQNQEASEVLSELVPSLQVPDLTTNSQNGGLPDYGQEPIPDEEILNPDESENKVAVGDVLVDEDKGLAYTETEVTTDNEGNAIPDGNAIKKAIKELSEYKFDLEGTLDNLKKAKRKILVKVKEKLNEKVNIEMPMDVFNSLEESKVDILSLDFDKVKIDVQAGISKIEELKDIGNNAKIRFMVEKIKKETAEKVLSKAYEEYKTLQDMPVFQFSASAVDEESGSNISLDKNLGDGVNVEIPMDNIDTSVIDTDKLTAMIYVEDADHLQNPTDISTLNTWQPVGGKYDPELKSFKFTRKSFSMYTIMQINKSFDDLAKYEWAKKDIEIMASKGIVTGKASNKFDPTADVTRAEFATLIVRTLGLLNNKAKVNFKDVNINDWYYTAVASAYNEGIVTGKGNNTFDANAPISRQEMMKMTANAMEKVLDMELPKQVEINNILSPFSDKNTIENWAKQGIALTIKEKIINGSTATTINPNGKATRAEAAVIMKRLYDIL